MKIQAFSGAFYEKLIGKLQQVVESERRASRTDKAVIERACTILDKWSRRYTLDRVIDP